MAGSKQPEVIVRVTAEGAGAAAAELEKVADAQEDVAEAADKAADSAKKAGDAAAAGQSKWAKLVGKLKEGAGAAAGASAGIAGVAATLATDLDEGTKLAVAGLQGLSGVLSAFGPLGQLAATGVSLATAAIAALKDGEVAAYEATRDLADEWRRLGSDSDFFAASLGRVSAQFEDFAKQASKAKEAQDAFISAAGGAALLPEQYRRGGAALTAAVDSTTTRVTDLQKTLDLLYEKSGGGIGDYRDAIAATTQELASQQHVLRAQMQALERYTSEAKSTRDALGNTAQFGPEAPAAAPKAGPAKARIDAQANFNALMLQAASKFEDAKLAIERAYAEKREADVQASTDRLLALYAARAEADRAIAKQAEDAQLAAAAAVQAEWDETFGKIGDAATNFGASMAEATAASLLFGDSFSEVAEQALKSLAIQAGGEALMEGARSLAAFATYLLNPFNVGALASSQTHALAAAGFAAIAGGAALGANAFSGGGGSGGGGGAGAGAAGPPQAFSQERPAPQEPQDREFFINLTSGTGGAGQRPLDRATAGAIVSALVQIARDGGVRLETQRA